MWRRVSDPPEQPRAAVPTCARQLSAAGIGDGRTGIVEIFDGRFYAARERFHVAQGEAGGGDGISNQQLQWPRPDVEGVHLQHLVGPHDRSEEHTSELQSHVNLVCRLLLEKKKKNKKKKIK